MNLRENTSYSYSQLKRRVAEISGLVNLLLDITANEVRHLDRPAFEYSKSGVELKLPAYSYLSEEIELIKKRLEAILEEVEGIVRGLFGELFEEAWEAAFQDAIDEMVAGGQSLFQDAVEQALANILENGGLGVEAECNIDGTLTVTLTSTLAGTPSPT